MPAQSILIAATRFETDAPKTYAIRMDGFGRASEYPREFAERHPSLCPPSFLGLIRAGFILEAHDGEAAQ